MHWEYVLLRVFRQIHLGRNFSQEKRPTALIASVLLICVEESGVGPETRFIVNAHHLAVMTVTSE